MIGRGEQVFEMDKVSLVGVQVFPCSVAIFLLFLHFCDELGGSTLDVFGSWGSCGSLESYRRSVSRLAAMTRWISCMRLCFVKASVWCAP
jgi:hypothetical protein